MRFNGSDYTPKLDNIRLTGQIQRIYTLMQDEHWRTLSEIAQATNDPEASISAQLRHLRKERFGKHIVKKRRRGNRKRGLFEYQLLTSSNGVPKPKWALNLVFNRQHAILKKYVDVEEFKKIMDKLCEAGYRYNGDGVWFKP